MGEESAEVVRGVYDALGRGDMPAVLGAMADNLEWYEAEGMPYGGVYQGGEAVAQNVFGPLIEDIPDFAVNPEEFISSGEHGGRGRPLYGHGQGHRKELDLVVAHVWDVRSGKVARFRQFVDTAKFLEVVPADVATTA